MLKEKISSLFKASVTVSEGPEKGRNFKITNPVLFETENPNIFTVENKFTTDEFRVEHIPLKTSEDIFFMKVSIPSHDKYNYLQLFFECEGLPLYIQYNFHTDKFYLCSEQLGVNEEKFESFFMLFPDYKERMDIQRKRIHSFIDIIEDYTKIAPSRPPMTSADYDPFFYVLYIISDERFKTWADYDKRYIKS